MIGERTNSCWDGHGKADTLLITVGDDPEGLRSIVLVRPPALGDKRTRDYIDRRVRAGRTKREAVRCG